ncbi:MAG TPA: N-acetyl-alpha-D-glucosaminyl L-malate synthase BshA [Blastocatellia bacterium]|jgi:N-acetyl-alpha-D-glucosaminyl L-malate synthase BshA|nr:N-acetyl-alpha-D-glucosaminyl L-malate synthase BshA [Blastocatellia bacterium]
MNIGITCYPSYGGSGVVGAELGLELAKRGHSIHFISYAPPMRLGDGNGPRERIHFHSVDMLSYPLFEYPPYTLALASKLREVAVDQRLDLVHMHYAIPHAVSAYLAREMLRSERALPVVTTLHGTDITLVGKDPSFLPITRFGIEQSDGVTAISRYLRDATYETFCNRCKIEVIYNFIDAEYYRRAPSDSLRRALAPGGEKIILHISTFRPIKRITDCIEVLARIKSLESGSGSQLRAKLVMCGDGPERADAEALAARLGVERFVEFVGKQPQPQVRDYLSAADVFLLPSESESFGLSALEAMACEVPVMATRVGGVPEVVEEGGCGYLFDVGDVNAMAERTLRVLNDEDERKRLGRRGREIAITRFATEKIIPQYEELYRKVIGGK